MERYSKDLDYSYILGISLIVEALKEVPSTLKEVVLSSKANKNKELDKLLSLCKENHVPISQDDLLISKLSLKENCYGIGFFNKYQKELDGDEHLVLYNFSNMGELGTILRSAVSFDFKNVVLINPQFDYFDPKVIRASMGSFFHLNIQTYNSLKDYTSDYPYHLYPFTGDGDVELNDLKLVKPYSLLIPQNYHDLDGQFKKSYYLKHSNDSELSLTSISTIVLNNFYHLKRK